jgi:hypothetical protein
MADQFEASPDTIRAASQQFSAVGITARTINQNLLAILQGLGPLAGRDAYGAEVDAVMNPAVDGTSQVLLGVGDGMDQTTTNLLTTADLYDKANGLNTDLSNKLASP